MAEPDLEFYDGFDKYGVMGYILATDDGAIPRLTDNWNQFDGTIASPVGPVGVTGYGVFPGGNYLRKYFSTTYARMLGTAWIRGIGSSVHMLFALGNNASTEYICVAADSSTGTFHLRRGNYNGTILQSSPMNLFNSASEFTIAVDIVPKNTGGTAKVWFNNTLVIDYTGDTTTSGSDGYNGLHWYGNHTLDHLWTGHYLAAGGSELPPLTNPIIVSDEVDVFDTSTFDFGAATLGSNRVSHSGLTIQANSIHLRKVTAVADGTLQSLSWYNSGGTTTTGKMRPVIYADDGSGIKAGALIAEGNEIVGWGTGLLTLTFPSPPAIVAGTIYWIGFHTDTAAGQFRIADTSPTQTSMRIADTYAGGAADPAGNTSGTNYEYTIWGNVTGVTDLDTILRGWDDQANNYAYLASDVVGDEDLLTFPALPFTPTAIYSVKLNGFFSKSDAGVKTMDLRLKSGASTSSGSKTGFSPNLTFTGYSSYFRKDPNGTIDWTKAAVDAVLGGYKIQS